MALDIDTDTKTELDAIGVDTATAYSDGTAVSGNQAYPPIPGFKDLKPDNQQLGVKGVLSTLVGLVKALRRRDRQDMTLLNGFAPYSPSFGTTARIWRGPDGMVHVEGLVTTPLSPSGKNVFILPDGYRPVSNRIFPVVSGGAFAHVYVTSTGAVQLVGGTASSWLSLDGISFSVI